MGFGIYNETSRNLRASTLSYASVTTDNATFKKTFKQQDIGHAHDSMSSIGLRTRECFDSEEHPSAIPLILGLDVTGSMLDLPKQLIAKGLPDIMSRIIEKGVDVSLCFLAIGDHDATTDRYPLQVGQFESCDEKLDTWLTNTYLEGQGGGNGGESYMLAWLFAAFFTKTDAWEKRRQKGFLFTFGDEPNLPELSLAGLNKVLGPNHGFEKGFTSAELLQLAQEKFHVFHLNIRHGFRSGTVQELGWKEVLGQYAIDVNGFQEVPDMIVRIMSDTRHYNVTPTPKKQESNNSTQDNSSPTFL